MKKLIVCLVAVGFAVGTQAAVYDWKTSANMQGVNAAGVTDNGDYAAGTVNMKNQGTWSAILALYDTTTGDLVGQSASTAIKFSTTGSKANTSGINVAAAEAGKTYNYKLTITGTQTALTGRGEDTDAGFDYSGALLTTTISGTIETAPMGSTILSSAAPSTWTVSGIASLTPPTPPDPPGPGPIPEPTSGLLLLVGGAMLALRRKQK